MSASPTEFFAGKPGDFAEFAVGGGWVAIDDGGLVDSGDVSDTIAVRVGDLVIRPAELIEGSDRFKA
jgi:hypothetical protein